MLLFYYYLKNLYGKSHLLRRFLSFDEITVGLIATARTPRSAGRTVTTATAAVPVTYRRRRVSSVSRISVAANGIAGKTVPVRAVLRTRTVASVMATATRAAIVSV